MIVTVNKATDIQRNDKGMAYAWKSAEFLNTFYTSKSFIKYINSLDKLEDIVAFSGSAGTVVWANRQIAEIMKARETN